MQREAKALREGGVEIIIALGHSGYDIDQVIQRLCQATVAENNHNSWLKNMIQLLVYHISAAQ